MPTANASLIHSAMELSGNLLYAMTAVVVIFGLLVVALSFRGSHQKQ